MLMQLPKVTRRKEDLKNSEFPLKHYSYSSMRKFSSDPFTFRLNYVQGQYVDSLTKAPFVLGNAFHKAMQVYNGGDDEIIVCNESEALMFGLEAGVKYIDSQFEGMVDWTKKLPNKQKLQELLVFMFNSYTSEMPYSQNEIIEVEAKSLEKIDVEWNGKQLSLPIPLKGYMDKVVRDDKGRIVIIDYKTTQKYSDMDKIDAGKLLQASVYYFLAFVKYGEAPYSSEFHEVKSSKNSIIDPETGKYPPQTKVYEFVYEEMPVMFELFFRFYQDMTDAIMGKMVWVPNIADPYNSDESQTALIGYIHRLDDPEELSKLMKELQVENVSDLLKKKLESKRNDGLFLKTIEKNLRKEFTKIDYSKLSMHEKIQRKMIEFGIIINYVDTVKGHNVTQYRYEPTVGVRMTTLLKHEKDFEQVLGVANVRVLAPIPNTPYVGVEVPNQERTFPESMPANNGYELAIGCDIYGKEVKFDITEAPHMLVAGSTGSGKSVFMDTLIEQLKSCTYTDIHLIDPKMVEFAHHIGDKNVKNHMTDPESIDRHLAQLVKVMNKRYTTLLNAGVKSIKEHNGSMRHIFVFIDEYGDLIVSKHEKVETIETGMYERGPKAGTAKTKTVVTNISKQIEKNILVLSQKGRACGIHLIIATQRPSTDIISGSIKNNFPTKAVFRTGKAIDSQVVIDQAGAEKLTGKGDMLFSTHEGVERLQAYKL